MKKVLVVLPAYNAEKTLEKTYREIPRGMVDDILLVDDASRDGTVALARRLGIRVIVHERNTGYGGNQKTCYRYALDKHADIVVMLHPDYQYDPGRIPDLLQPIIGNRADVVLGSRILHGNALKGGMPLYKYVSNRFLTWVENLTFGFHLSEYHSGFRAYSREVLEAVPFRRNSNGFLFDTEIIVQAVHAGFRFSEIAVPCRYCKDSSSVGFVDAVWYGIGTLVLMLKYIGHRRGWWGARVFREVIRK